MSLKTCNLCSKPFATDEGQDWANTCLPCWKHGRGYDLTKSDKSYVTFQDEVSNLRIAHDMEIAQLREEVKREREAKERAMRFSGRSAPFTQEQVRNLIRLCHPDRHNGSELATEVTKWLLELRERR